MTVENIPGLNLEAWNRWLMYRQAIKKPYKDISLNAAALKLSNFGPDQLAVVDQSIANQWQGLFAVDKPKADPHAPKERTPKEKAAADQHWEWANKQSAKWWDQDIHNPIAKIHLAEALLARYDILDDGLGVWSEKRDHLKERVAALVREAGYAACLKDLTVIRIGRRFWPNFTMMLEQRMQQREAT